MSDHDAPPATSSSAQQEARRVAIADALDAAWGDWIADTGCIPDCFTIHGPGTTRVEADFRRGNFAEHVLGWLTAAGFMLVHPAASADNCMDPWECCIHERPQLGVPPHARPDTAVRP